jgi:hypothetical protein
MGFAGSCLLHEIFQLPWRHLVTLGALRQQDDEYTYQMKTLSMFISRSRGICDEVTCCSSNRLSLQHLDVPGSHLPLSLRLTCYHRESGADRSRFPDKASICLTQSLLSRSRRSFSHIPSQHNSTTIIPRPQPCQSRRRPKLTQRLPPAVRRYVLILLTTQLHANMSQKFSWTPENDRIVNHLPPPLNKHSILTSFSSSS